jgi:hypothetical protein
MTKTIWEPFDNLKRIYIAAISAGCVGLFYTVSRMLGWPAYLKCEASLLASSSPVIGMVSLIVGMLLALFLATLLLGQLRYEAGLFAACIGLAALANRGGTVASLLRTVGSPRVYVTLLVESITLLGVMGLAWQLLALLNRRGWLLPEPLAAENDQQATITTGFAAAALQATITALLLIALIQVDNKKQVTASVVIASLIGAVISHQFFSMRPSPAFWIGPFLVAIFGYAWAIKSPGNWMIGTPANALAAASPLDYASLGTAGSIFGYWISRQWREAEVEIELPEDALD